ncbi:MAG: TraR/DksA C4-type zinc finger protein, partial [Betaproteobacteria bacterium AqS2]|nr:TraR/DksA C4-type zinc finger protein [Betaproteobacteria bacterium AqS2]
MKKKAASRARPAPKKKAAARKKPAAKRKAAARRPAAKKAAIRRPAVKKTAPKKAAVRKAAKPSRLADQAETQSRVEEMLREGPPEAKAYMSAGQKKWFRSLLEEMLSEIRSEAERTNQELLMQEKDLADELDRAHSEYRFVVDLRENERISQLQVKISHSLRMLESGDYGICEDCGVQIGIKRMASRPMATKCIDCKNFQEDL